MKRSDPIFHRRSRRRRPTRCHSSVTDRTVRYGTVTSRLERELMVHFAHGSGTRGNASIWWVYTRLIHRLLLSSGRPHWPPAQLVGVHRSAMEAPTDGQDWARVFSFVGSIVFVGVILVYLQAILVPFILAIFLAYLVRPFAEFISNNLCAWRRRREWRRVRAKGGGRRVPRDAGPAELARAADEEERASRQWHARVPMIECDGLSPAGAEPGRGTGALERAPSRLSTEILEDRASVASE